MQARFTFLSGPCRGRRIVLKDPVITVGGDPTHTVYFSDLETNELLVRIARREHSYTIMAAAYPAAAVRLNGADLDAGSGADVVLQDGDLIQIAEAHTICFSTVPERGELPKPLGQIVGRSWRAAGHLRGGAPRRGLFLLRELCHCVAHDASRAARLGSSATFVALGLALLVGGFSLLHVRGAERRVVALSAEVARSSVSHRQLEREVARLHEIEQDKADAEARFGEVSRNLKTAEERMTRLEHQTPDPLAGIDAARRSVALLVVGYGMYEEASGRPLRAVLAGTEGNPRYDLASAHPVSVEGTGPPVTSYAMGSGFLIGGGRIVTNHHIAEPWWEDASIESAVRSGFKPRQTVARAYFPGVREPVELRVAAISAEADVAVMTGTVPKALPPLMLAAPDQHVSVGDQITVVAYPTGFDALLARIDSALAGQLVQDTGGEPSVLAGALATRNLISPLVTVGHVGDVGGRTIIYDAASTHGSSGGPVLNARGEVIALNHAALEDFTGARFGIPVTAVHRLLKQPRKRDGS